MVLLGLRVRQFVAPCHLAQRLQWRDEYAFFSSWSRSTAPFGDFAQYGDRGAIADAGSGLAHVANRAGLAAHADDHHRIDRGECADHRTVAQHQTRF